MDVPELVVVWATYEFAGLAVLGLALFLWRYLDEDWLSPLQVYSRGWMIQHDEKHVVAEGRVFAYRSGSEINDFYWPITPSLGVIGPLWASIGFRLFDLSLRGLRAPFFLIGFLVVLFNSLSIASLIPWLSCVLILYYLLNVETWSVWRQALPEHFLMLYLSAFTVCLISNVGQTEDVVLIFAVIGGALGMVKIHFPVIAALFVFSMIVGLFAEWGRLEWGLLGWAVVAGSVSWLISEGLQSLILRRMGFSSGVRWRNLTASLGQHRGQPHPLRVDAGTHKPSGYKVFQNLAYDLKGHYRFSVPVLLAALLLLIGIGLGRGILVLGALDGTLVGLVLFLVLHQAIHWGVAWYPKRGFTVYPTVLITLGLAVDLVADQVALTLGLGGTLALAALVIGVLGGVVALWNRQTIRLLWESRTQETSNHQETLAGWVPEGQTIYADCYAARFLWTKAHRFISADYLLMTGQDVLDWAALNGGHYVLLSSLEGIRADKTQWQVSMEFTFGEAACGEPMTCFLLEWRGLPPMPEEAGGVAFKGEYAVIDAYRASHAG